MKISFTKFIIANGKGAELHEDVPTGYSFSVALFGFIAIAMRRQYLFALLVFFFQLVTFGFGALLIAFIANRHWAVHLIENGWNIETDPVLIPNDWKITSND